MKKVLSVFVALVLAAIMSVTAFAATVQDDVKEKAAPGVVDSRTSDKSKTIFVKSIEQKGAPSVVKVVTESGEEVAAIIYTVDGVELIGVPEEHLILTPLSEAEEASEDVRLALENSYDELVNAKSIKDVVPGFEKEVKRIAPDTDPDDYVVKDLFSVSLDGKYVKYMDGSNIIMATYETGVDPDEPMVFMFNDEGTWRILDESEYVRNPDGTVTFYLPKLGVMAFVVHSSLVNGGEKDIEKDKPKSPYTGDLTMAVAGLGGFCLVSGVVIYRKRKNKVA